MVEFFLIAMALFLAFNNGANDNFKGFATVWGAQALSYRHALILATVATLAGSLASWFLADTLLQQFSGRGLVPDAVASHTGFILSVASAAALTVFLATRLGFPISTTHALIGGLVGAGLAQATGEVNFSKLLNAFFVPLLLSPVLATGLGAAIYFVLPKRKAEQDCVCVVQGSPGTLPLAAAGLGSAAALQGTFAPQLVIASEAQCDMVPVQARFSLTQSMQWLHIGSAASICFARAVNDTPKLAALLIASKLVGSANSILLVGILMGVGGLVFAQRVAHTMSQRINRMSDSQGLTANLITAALVLLASKFGLPVSTTHVSVGAIAGVGMSAKTVNWPALRGVLLSWVATLPLAMAIAWVVSQLVR
jgi:inorganic phosphate transporter, PiT family